MANAAMGLSRNESMETATPAQIYLQPIAAPSILGLFGFAGATFIVAAHMAHWYGGANSPCRVLVHCRRYSRLVRGERNDARGRVSPSRAGQWKGAKTRNERGRRNRRTRRYSRSVKAQPSAPRNCPVFDTESGQFFVN